MTGTFAAKLNAQPLRQEVENVERELIGVLIRARDRTRDTRALAGADQNGSVTMGVYGFDRLLVGNRRGVFRGGCAGGGHSGIQQRQQFEPQAVFANDPDDAQGGAAQREGIAGASRPLVDGEEAGELVQLVRQGDGNGDRRGRVRDRDGAARRVV